MAFINEEKFLIGKKINPPPQSARIVIGGTPAFIPLSGMIDIEKEKIRIQTSLEKVREDKLKLEKKLKSPFSERAPEELVQREWQRLEELQIQIEQFEEQMKILD